MKDTPKKVAYFNNRRVAESLAFTLALTDIVVKMKDSKLIGGLSETRLRAVHDDIVDVLVLTGRKRRDLMKASFDIVNNNIYAVAKDATMAERLLSITFMLKNVVEQGAMYVSARSNMENLLVDLLAVSNALIERGIETDPAMDLAKRTMSKLQQSGYYTDVVWAIN